MDAGTRGSRAMMKSFTVGSAVGEDKRRRAEGRGGGTGRGMVVVVVVVGVQPGAGWPVFKTHSLSSPPTPRQDVEDREPFKSTKVGEQ